jgi:hypothetical protein
MAVSVNTGANLHTPLFSFSPFVADVVLRGLEGDDTFNVTYPLSPAATVPPLRIEGGEPSGSDVLNFTGAGGGVTVAGGGASTTAGGGVSGARSLTGAGARVAQPVIAHSATTPAMRVACCTNACGIRRRKMSRTGCGSAVGKERRLRGGAVNAPSMRAALT